MATKMGRIVRWGRTGKTFTEAYLDSGARVELPHELVDVAQQLVAQRLVFVERRGRLFHFVQWIGTPRQARDAYDGGILKRGELTEEVLIEAIAEGPAGLRIAVAAMRGIKS